MIKYLPLAFLFCFFLIPITTDEGLSVNYSFVIFPFAFILVKGQLQKPARYAVVAFILFTVIFFIGILNNLFENINLITRALISFLIFISALLFSFVSYKENIIISFKWAIVLTSIYFSLNSIYKFIKLDTSDLGLIKELIGSQRTGFIHSMAIFLILIPNKNFKLKDVFKYSLVLIILIGLFLTFSRTPIISLVLTYLILSFSSFKFQRLLMPKWYFNLVFLSLATTLFIFLLYIIIPDIFLFFNERLIEKFFLSPSQDAILNPETSEGTRVEIWKTILNYCILHPIQGSGYLGAYVLESKIVFGSSHSQYMDVLLRTGFIGILFYLFLIYRTSIEVYKVDKSLFWGFISILIYGLFHETFKESQGGFIFAFLFGYGSYLHTKRVIPKSNKCF